MVTTFTDCCIRYGQEYVYTTFSEGKMTLGEIYMSLAYGLIDPACLPAMAIIRHDNKVWCTDTRRLTLSKELERRGRFDILELMKVRQVQSNTPEYREFVHHRLPAMSRKGLNGLTIKISDKRGPTCCFNSDNRFRNDLEEHIVQDHLENFTLEIFKNLTVYHCNICNTTTQIMCTKSKVRSYYTIIRKCGCRPKHPYQFARPWTQLTFAEICNGLLQYNPTLRQKLTTQNGTIQPKNTKKGVRTTATQTTTMPVGGKPLDGVQDSQKIPREVTETVVPLHPVSSGLNSIRRTPPEHCMPPNRTQNQTYLESHLPSNRILIKDTSTKPAVREIKKIQSNIHTTKVPDKNQVLLNPTESASRKRENQKLLDTPETKSKLCCIIS